MVTDKPPVVPVEFEQARSLCCNPQSAVLVFEYSHYSGQGGAGRFLIEKRIVSQCVRLPVKHG